MPGTTVCAQDACQAATCQVPAACAQASAATTAPQAGKGIRVECGNGAGNASKGDFCEAQGFVTTGGTAVAPIAVDAQQAGETAVTRKVRRKLGRKTGAAVFRLKLNKVGRQLLAQAGKSEPPLPLPVSVQTQISSGGQTSSLRMLVSLLSRGR